MKNSIILDTKPLDFMFPVSDPFLFCAHHEDDFPKGNSEMGPAASLTGRNIGQDFTIKDGFRMYHGHKIPGFPVHPHRGFETVTIVTKGMVDHCDSHGQAGRYGQGDVQWMTAGAGLQHSEMFPLLNTEEKNPAELFQVWLNLPKARKFANPHFKMLWSEDIPKITISENGINSVEINIIAGGIGETMALAPAPDSWAADPENHVAIWTIKMKPGAKWIMPASDPSVNRTLYFYKGSSVSIQQNVQNANHAFILKADENIEIINGNTEGYFLILQGKPISEPVVQYGPFVMNTEAEIQQAIQDYRRTEFGGWPWPRPDQVHDRSKGRFAKHTDGTEEIK